MSSFNWWVTLLIGFAFLELSSPGLFFFLSFSIGAAIAALFSLYSGDTTVEFMVFLGSSIGAFIALKRYVKRISKDTLYTTNVYALRGKKAVVTERITPLEKGWVTIEGQLWSALPLHDEYIEKGLTVLIVNSAGSHLIVKKIDLPL